MQIHEDDIESTSSVLSNEMRIIKNIMVGVRLSTLVIGAGLIPRGRLSHLRRSCSADPPSVVSSQASFFTLFRIFMQLMLSCVQ